MKTNYELFDEAFKENIKSGVQRQGQATFNSVCTVDSEIADKLRGTEKDCFYDDSKIDEFMTEVYTKWGRL